MRICGICDKIARYTIERPMGLHVCEDCVGLAWTIHDQDKRRAYYSGRPVTLDGEPAKIVGFLNDFATVATVDAGGSSFEWSWRAVARVVSRGGRFSSGIDQ